MLLDIISHFTAIIKIIKMDKKLFAILKDEEYFDIDKFFVIMIKAVSHYYGFDSAYNFGIFIPYLQFFNETIEEVHAFI